MKESYVKSGGADIFLTYNDKPGPGDERETILFIHGFPDSHKTWSYQLEALEELYIVAAIDIRGTSRSGKVGKHEMNIKDILPDIQAVIDFLAPRDGKLHLVGHDWGGLIGWLVISHPEFSPSIKSFTSIGAPHPALARDALVNKFTSFNIFEMLSGLNQITNLWYMWLFQLPYIPEMLIETIGPTLLDYMITKGEIPEDDPLLALPREELEAAAIPAINLYRRLFQGERLKAPTTTLTTPTQVLLPLRDLAINPDMYAGMDKFLDSLEVKELDTNHWAHRQEPDLVTHYIRDFVKKAGQETATGVSSRNSGESA